MGKRKGLPKKYAKMGFKKGWAAYKRTRGTSKRIKNPKRRVKTMAKRKRYNKYAQKAKKAASKIPSWAYYGVAGYFNETIDSFAVSAAGRFGGVSVDMIKFVAPMVIKKLIKPTGATRGVLNAVQNIGAFEIGRQLKVGGLNFGNLLGNSTSQTSPNGVNNNMEVW